MNNKSQFSIKKRFLTSLILLTCFLIANGQTRDPFLQPFSKESIWNLPIHKDAWKEGNHVDANIDKVGLPAGYKAEGVHFFIEDTNDPKVEYHRVRWSNRCTNHYHYKNNYVHIPDDFTHISEKTSQANGAWVMLKPDKETIWDALLLTRCKEGSWFGGNWFGPDKPYSIYGKGWGDHIWGHGASEISAMGGTIRKGELTSPEDEPIRHPLKFTIEGNRYWASCKIYGSKNNFVWPAYGTDRLACDESFKNHHGGKDPNFVCGCLLALPPDLTKEQLGIKTLEGKKIFDALQTYGAYTVENSGWDSWQFLIEADAIATDWPSGDFVRIKSGDFHDDIDAMLSKLHIILKNNPENIAGGPTTDFENRMAPPACEFGEVGSELNCGTATSSLQNQSIND
jgi:hypothetical protein